MNETFLFDLNYEQNLSSFALESSSQWEFLINTVTATTTTTSSSSNVLLHLFNSTKIYSLPRQSTSFLPPTSSLVNKYFVFKLPFHQILRLVELCILSLTLPLYAIVFILFIELTVQRISSNTTISGGGTRMRSQRRRQRMRSLIWTSNYLLVDFLGLLYEVIYVIIHLTGDLALNSLAGRFYCQLQAYLPLYLTALMAYSLAAISIYRRRHFVNLNNQSIRSNKESFLLVLLLWIMPIITSIMPAYLLTYHNILRITQHELTNECQISYPYGSTIVAIYMCYRLGNIFLLPLSISFACYLTICVDLIRMQRRFSRAFDRHVHIRKNLILQILFLFLNFAALWLPAEIITLYTKNRLLKDTVQVTKSLNIFLDPIIITGFDTRFSSAAQQLLSKWRLEMCLSNMHRHTPSSSASTQLVTSRRGTTIKRLRRLSPKNISQRQASTGTWNIVGNDDITMFEATSNHVSMVNEKRPIATNSRRQLQQQQQRRKRHLHARRQPSNPARVKITDNHLTGARI